MCFHSKQTKDAVTAEKRFNAVVESLVDFQPTEHFNGFAYPQTPVITGVNRHLIQHFRWGLIPEWATDDTIRQFTLNAKIETLNEKPSFRNSVNKRCLVIADGFYEWQWLDSKGKRKQKYEITLPGKGLFAFAGIWSEWQSTQTGELMKSYSIVTTEASGLMREIHNSKKRMPVILTPENEQEWLDNQSLKEFESVNVELLASKMDVAKGTGLLF
jgi:putative SOS response-associated peptidase YedK